MFVCLWRRPQSHRQTEVGGASVTTLCSPPAKILSCEVCEGADDAVSDEFLLQGREIVFLQHVQSVQQLWINTVTEIHSRAERACLTVTTVCFQQLV